MDETQKAEIEALMQQHDARTGKRADDQRADDEFATAFGRLRHEVIKPAMEQIVQQLKAGGHHAAIGDANPTPAKTGKKAKRTVNLGKEGRFEAPSARKRPWMLGH